jgi:hypothetical protein
MVKVTLDRPVKKKLGSTAIVAMKRNPKTGKIQNQEWWDYEEFVKVLTSVVHRSSDYFPVHAYRYSRVPKWIRWLLGKPESLHSEYVNYFVFEKTLARIVFERLEEDKNRSKK